MLLDRSTWDICKDAKGNIAVADDPYAVAQDAASALRLFKGECWYDTTRGVPYFEQTLGRSPPLGVLKASFVKAALSVPEVTAARAFILGVDNRTVTGQVQLTTKTGATFGLTETMFGRQRGPFVPAKMPSAIIPSPVPSVTLTLFDDPPFDFLRIEWVAADGPEVAGYHVQLSADSGRTWPFDFAVGTAPPLRADVVITTSGFYQARVAAVAGDGRTQSEWTVSNTVSVSDVPVFDALLNPEGVEIISPDGVIVFVRQ